MEQLIFILFITSIILFIIELILPGIGVFSILGITLMLLSGILTIIYIPFGFEMVIGIGILLAFIGYRIYKLIKNKKIYSNIILKETVNIDEKSIVDYTHLLDKDGITITPLRPYGIAEFNGTELEVSSNGDYIEINVKVRVISINNDKIIVKKIN